MQAQQALRKYDQPTHLIHHFRPRLSDAQKTLFLSCSYADDLDYAIRFANYCGDDFHCVMVEPFDPAQSSGLEYVRWLAGSEHLTADATLVVLVGPESGLQQNVDWDMAAALSSGKQQASGLVGIMLPEYFHSKYHPNSMRCIPPRLIENTKTNYAKVYTWDYILGSRSNLNAVMNEASIRARDSFDSVVNRAPLLKA